MSGEQTSEELARIVEEAKRSAEQLREQAESEVREVRERAKQEAEDHLAEARSAAGGLVERIGELEQAVDGLRERANALEAEIEKVAGGLGGAEPDGGEREETEAGEEEVPGTGLTDADLDAAEAELSQDGDGGKSDGESSADGDGDGDRTGVERARLVALNMALSGSPREETESHIRERFEVDDPEPILDEVYERAERAE